MSNINRYAVIFSHPASPDEGVMAMVDAPSLAEAESDCLGACHDPQSLFEGHDFTVWPVPVPETYGRCHWCPEMRHDGPCP